MARQRPGTAFPRREQWSASRTGEGLGSARSVDRVFETLACLELWLLRGGDLEGLAGAGVATLRGCALANIKGAEADEANLLSLLQRLRDRIEYGIHSLGGIGFGELGHSGNRIDEFVLVHELAPLLFSARSLT